MTGVQTCALPIFKDPHHFTTFAFVSLMLDGERDFYFNRGADGQLSENDLQALNLSDYNIVHFGSATGCSSQCFITPPVLRSLRTH